MGCNRVFDQVLPGHIGFFLSLFFLQPGLVLALGLPSPRSTREAGFQNYGFAGQGRFKSIGSSGQEVQKLLSLAEQPNPKLLGPAGSIVSSTMQTLIVYSVVHSAMSLCPQRMHNIFLMPFKVQHNYLSLTSYFFKPCPVPAPGRPGQPANSYIILDNTPSRARWRPNELHALGYVGSFCVFECLM